MAMDAKEFDCLGRFFTAISVNPEESELAMTYLTAESISQNCPKYWGHPCEWFCQRLHAILSDNVAVQPIRFKTFKEKFYDNLINPKNTNSTKTSFIFKMLDHDNDGLIDSSDLLKSFELISMESKFGRELHKLMDWFTETNIKPTECVI